MSNGLARGYSSKVNRREGGFTLYLLKVIRYPTKNGCGRDILALNSNEILVINASFSSTLAHSDILSTKTHMRFEHVSSSANVQTKKRIRDHMKT